MYHLTQSLMAQAIVMRDIDIAKEKYQWAKVTSCNEQVQECSVLINTKKRMITTC